MAIIDKKFIHFKTLSAFQRELESGNILETSIVYIKDVKKIYTHGEYYDCSGLSEDQINKISKIKTDGEGNLFLSDNGEYLDPVGEINSEITSHIENTSNPHNVTKEQIGLDQVDNTSDLNKPISTATQEALDKINESVTSHTSNTSNPHNVTKAQVGLDKVDNTSDLEKPVSTAQQEAINAAKEEVNQALTTHIGNKENPHSVTKEQIGLSNVTNDAQVKRSEMGVASGVATLNENGKIPVSQLDGQMARVFGIEKAVKNQAALPEDATKGQKYYTIDTKKIYEKLEDSWDSGTDPKEDTIYNFRHSDATGNEERTNILYRWDGESLVEISSSIALGESKGTAYEGDKGKANRDAINSLPGTIISQISGSTPSTDSVTLEIKKVTKSGMNYGTEEDSNVVISSATSSLAGVMSSADKSNLDSIKTKVDELTGDGESSIDKKIENAVNSAKSELVGDAATYNNLGLVEDKIETIDSDITSIKDYTVNGKKISENPILGANDINLTGFTLLGEEQVTEEQLTPVESDTVNQGIAKLHRAILNNEEVISAAINTINDSLGFTEGAMFTPSTVELNGLDVTKAIDETYSKLKEINSLVEDLDWYEGE